MSGVQAESEIDSFKNKSSFIGNSNFGKDSSLANKASHRRSKNNLKDSQKSQNSVLQAKSKSKKSSKSILKTSKNSFQTARELKKINKLKLKTKSKDHEKIDDYDYETGTFGWEREQGLQTFDNSYEYQYDCVPSGTEDSESESESEVEESIQTDKHGFRVKPKKARGKLVDKDFDEHYSRKEEMDLIRKVRQ